VPRGKKRTDDELMADARNYVYAVRCSFESEKRYEGQRWVDSRRQCRNMTKSPDGRCHHHPLRQLNPDYWLWRRDGAE
jgi:hypothetical protein